MTQSAITLPPAEARGQFWPITKAALLLIVIVATFGQPNGLFLYFPAYPVLALLLMLLFTSMLIVDKVVHSQEGLRLPRLNLTIPLLLFFGDSLLSLVYAQDATFGARILFSMVFKVVLFLAMVDLCEDQSDVRRVLRVIMTMGVVFAVQGLCLVVALALFNIKPNAAFNSATDSGSVSYDYRLDSYGILGFSKVVLQVGNVSLTRCQAMFTEPGWFANFLELTLFATVAYYALGPAARRKQVYWLVGLQVVALLLSFSTAGMLCVGVGATVTVIIAMYGRYRELLRQLTLILLALVLLLAVTVVAVPVVAERVYTIVWASKFVSEWQGTMSSGEQRVAAYDLTLAQIAQRPWFGCGSNQLRVVMNSDFGANNALLTVTAELGVIGLLIYLAMMGAILFTVVENVVLAIRSGSQAMLLFTATTGGCVVAVILHSMFVDTNWNFFYWMAMALLYANRRLFAQNLGDKALVVDTSS